MTVRCTATVQDSPAQSCPASDCQHTFRNRSNDQQKSRQSLLRDVLILVPRGESLGVNCCENNSTKIFLGPVRLCSWRGPNTGRVHRRHQDPADLQVDCCENNSTKIFPSGASGTTRRPWSWSTTRRGPATATCWTSSGTTTTPPSCVLAR